MPPSLPPVLFCIPRAISSFALRPHPPPPPPKSILGSAVHAWGGLLPLLSLRSLYFCLRLIPSVPSVNDLWKFSAVTFSGCGGWKRLMFQRISARTRHASRWFPWKRLRSHHSVHLRGVASLQRIWKVSLKAFVGRNMVVGGFSLSYTLQNLVEKCRNAMPPTHNRMGTIQMSPCAVCLADLTWRGS